MELSFGSVASEQLALQLPIATISHAFVHNWRFVPVFVYLAMQKLFDYLFLLNEGCSVVSF